MPWRKTTSITSDEADSLWRPGPSKETTYAYSCPRSQGPLLTCKQLLTAPSKVSPTAVSPTSHSCVMVSRQAALRRESSRKSRTRRSNTASTSALQQMQQNAPCK